MSAATEKVGTSFKKLSSTVTGSFRDRGRVNSSEEDAGPLGEDQVGVLMPGFRSGAGLQGGAVTKGLACGMVDACRRAAQHPATKDVCCASQAPHYVRQPAAEYEAPAEREQMLRNPTAAAGAGATAPVASPPLDTMRETASFTLDDTDSPPAKQ